MRRSFIALAAVVLIAAGFVAGQLFAAQPHMEAALQHLRQARGSLERADADKGGHRVRAMEHVDAAIHEVEEGMKYDRRH